MRGILQSGMYLSGVAIAYELATMVPGSYPLAAVVVFVSVAALMTVLTLFVTERE